MVSETPVRDMLRAKGDPYAEELDRIEAEYYARYCEGGQRPVVAVDSRRRTRAELVGAA